MKITSIAVLALVGKISAERAQMMTIAEKLDQIKQNQSLAQSEGNDVKSAHQLAVMHAKNQLAGLEPMWGPDVKYSDQLANGDIDDDKELEDEDDPNDMIADDNGFVNQFVDKQDHRLKEWVQLPEDNEMLAEEDDDEDEDEDEEMDEEKEDEGDDDSESDEDEGEGDDEDEPKDKNEVMMLQLGKMPVNDPTKKEEAGPVTPETKDPSAKVAKDKGADDKAAGAKEAKSDPKKDEEGGDNTANQAADEKAGKDAKSADVDPNATKAQSNDNAGTKEPSQPDQVSEEQDRKSRSDELQADYAINGALPTADLWNADVKYSDQIANGDFDDDKEIEDEDDPNDDIVDDNGFVNQFVEGDDRRLREWSDVQISSDIKKPEAKGVTMLPQVKIQYHDELANGDQADDKELVDINDQNDDDVDENGYVLLNEKSSGRWARFQHNRPSENSLIQLSDSRQGMGFANPTASWGNIMAQVDSKRAMDSLY